MQSTERLASLIAKKHEVLVQLRAVGARQTDLVASGEIAGLLKLLAAKQHLINGLQQLERELKPYYAGDPDQRVWRSPEERAHCAKQAAECNTLLEEIVRLEKIGAEKMDVRKNEVAQQLQQVHAAAHVRNAYQAQSRGHA
jgi:flagellar biosynthesis/type III secretory pathway chaperone